MKKFAFALCAILCLALPSFADAQAAAPSGSEQSGGASKGGKGKMQEAMKACRQQVKGQGMTPGSKEMKDAVMQCVTKDHPGMANVLKCRMEGKEKGLKPGSDEMKAFVKDCKHKNG